MDIKSRLKEKEIENLGGYSTNKILIPDALKICEEAVAEMTKELRLLKTENEKLKMMVNRGLG